MQDDLQMLDEWIPEQMEPGTLFVLENAAPMGDALSLIHISRPG